MSQDEIIEEYSAYVTLANTVITMLLSITSLRFSLRVLFYKTFRMESQKLSPVITVYFGFLSFWCTAIVIDGIHFLIFWRPNMLIYNGTLLYFFGIFPWFCLYVNPMVELFLCLDRCLAITFPLQFNKRAKAFLAFLLILTLPLTIVAGFDINLLIDMASDESIETCQSFTCVILMHRRLYSMELRLGITVINMVSGLLLFWLLKFYRKLSSNKMKNVCKTVLIILGTAVVLDVLPTIMAQYFPDVSFICPRVSRYQMQ